MVNNVCSIAYTASNGLFVYNIRNIVAAAAFCECPDGMPYDTAVWVSQVFMYFIPVGRGCFIKYFRILLELSFTITNNII